MQALVAVLSCGLGMAVSFCTPEMESTYPHNLAIIITYNHKLYNSGAVHGASQEATVARGGGGRAGINKPTKHTGIYLFSCMLYVIV